MNKLELDTKYLLKKVKITFSNGNIKQGRLQKKAKVGDLLNNFGVRASEDYYVLNTNLGYKFKVSDIKEIEVI